MIERYARKTNIRISEGQEVIDQVTLAPGFVIQNQSLGVAIEDAGFDGLDGIIGYVTRYNMQDPYATEANPLFIIQYRSHRFDLWYVMSLSVMTYQ